MSEILTFLSTNLFLVAIFFLLCWGSIVAFFRRILERRHVAQCERAVRDHEYRMLVERRKFAEGMEKLVDAILVDKVLADDFERRLHARRGEKAIPPTSVRVEPSAPAVPVASEPEAPPARAGAVVREPRRHDDG